jgi:hypothetical protein
MDAIHPRWTASISARTPLSPREAILSTHLTALPLASAALAATPPRLVLRDALAPSRRPSDQPVERAGVKRKSYRDGPTTAPNLGRQQGFFTKILGQIVAFGPALQLSRGQT